MEYGDFIYIPMVSVSATCTFSLEATVNVCSLKISRIAFSVVERFGIISGLPRSAPLVSSIYVGKYIENKYLYYHIKFVVIDGCSF